MQHWRIKVRCINLRRDWPTMTLYWAIYVSVLRKNYDQEQSSNVMQWLTEALKFWTNKRRNYFLQLCASQSGYSSLFLFNHGLLLSSRRRGSTISQWWLLPNKSHQAPVQSPVFKFREALHPLQNTLGTYTFCFCGSLIRASFSLKKSLIVSLVHTFPYYAKNITDGTVTVLACVNDLVFASSATNELKYMVSEFVAELNSMHSSLWWHLGVRIHTDLIAVLFYRLPTL